ncbi:MAG: hypothetical protein FJ297_04735 [Planctomycetes bacterium]|nr:hypothetical protein [Planctomycetota bacterium]
MSLWSLFSRFWRDRSWHSLVERIAISCAAHLHTTIDSSIHTMSAAERYGYLRAKSTALVVRESRLHGANFSRERSERLVHDVRERVVALLIDQLRRPYAAAARRAA